MNDAKIDRHASVVAIGGGAMLDVVGFAAAITHRGVRLVRMPTTVLAQNDAGIGVKNGVNCFGKKNFLGSFAPPDAVINDFSLLRTLRPEQWRDGIAEAVKVGLIRDSPFFEWIEGNVHRLVERDADAFRYLIRRCAELHLQHITTSGDPFERGSARPLDFGHWSAHKLESLSNFQISHGHAVAIGMAIDATYAMKMHLCEEKVGRRILDCLSALQFPRNVGHAFALDAEALLGGIAEFREHLGGTLSLSMVPTPGRAIEIDRVDPSGDGRLRPRRVIWLAPLLLRAASPASIARTSLPKDASHRRRAAPVAWRPCVIQA